MIYFARVGGRRWIKIGCSRNVFLRLKQLEHVYGEPINFLGEIPGEFSEERWVHDRFAHRKDNSSLQSRQEARTDGSGRDRTCDEGFFGPPSGCRATVIRVGGWIGLEPRPKLRWEWIGHDNRAGNEGGGAVTYPIPEASLRTSRLPDVETLRREILLACARLYYDDRKRFSLVEIGEVFGVSVETIRTRVRLALTLTGPDGDEVRRTATQAKRIIQP